MELLPSRGQTHFPSTGGVERVYVTSAFMSSSPRTLMSSGAMVFSSIHAFW
jgi:hypothetical protein